MSTLIVELFVNIAPSYIQLIKLANDKCCASQAHVKLEYANAFARFMPHIPVSCIVERCVVHSCVVMNVTIMCFVDVDECVTNNGGCSFNAECNNTMGSFHCTCNTGYSGNGFTCDGISFIKNLSISELSYLW